MENIIETPLSIGVENWQSANRNLQDAFDLENHYAEEQWNLLEQVLGERLSEVNPRIVEFFNNPANLNVTSALELHTLPAKFWARALTSIFRQGLYESHLSDIPTRFRVSKRSDGAMHFVREFDCKTTAPRVFNSDFVVRNVNGTQTFFEVFRELGIDVEMEFEPTINGGLINICKKFSWRGWRIPTFGLQCEFQGVEEDKQLHFKGYLRMRPRTKFGKFLAYKILRRPQLLACLHYFVPIESNSVVSF